MKMTPRERLILCVLIVIGCCAVFYSYGYVPAMNKIEVADQRISELRAERSLLYRWQAESAGTQETIAELEEELAGWVSDSKAIEDVTLALLYWEQFAEENNIRLNLIRLGSASATMTFVAEDYESVRELVLEMEKLVGLEIAKARLSSHGENVDGAFDIRLHVGRVITEETEGTDKINPFERTE